MKELEVTVVVRNNRLKERRLALKMTQKWLAVAAGIPLERYAALETLRASPVKDGDWTKIARTLAAFFEVDEEELFPEAVQHVSESKAIRRVDLAEVGQTLTAPNVLPGLPDSLYDREEAAARVREVVSTLQDRERLVLSKRFGLDGAGPKTLADVAAEIPAYDNRGRIVPGHTIGRERVRNIEAKGLRRLRHPGRAKLFREQEPQEPIRADQIVEIARYDDLFVACHKCGREVRAWPQSAESMRLGWHHPNRESAVKFFESFRFGLVCSRCCVPLVVRWRDGTNAARVESNVDPRWAARPAVLHLPGPSAADKEAICAAIRTAARRGKKARS